MKVTRILSLGGAVAIGAAAMWWFGIKSKPEAPRGPPLLSLEAMGHLATVKVSYANVIEFTEKRTQNIPWTQWELQLGGTSVLLVARGDCLIGTDLRLAKYENTSGVNRTSVLVLAAPKAMSARVSHEPREKGGSYFYAINGIGLEPLIPGSANRLKAISSALGKAQEEIESSCSSPDVLATARQNAEAVLKPAFSAIGWNVQVRWLQ